MGDKLKSAYELALERLKAESGGEEDTPLTDRQKEAIAETRRVVSSRLAEREILYKDARKKAADEEALAKLEDEYRIDRQRIQDDGERAVAEIRKKK
jgi:hypothetical protein